MNFSYSKEVSFNFVKIDRLQGNNLKYWLDDSFFSIFLINDYNIDLEIININRMWNPYLFLNFALLYIKTGIQQKYFIQIYPNLSRTFFLRFVR